MDALFPTLAGEVPFGMDHPRIAGEFGEFINSTAGWDGVTEEEEEEPIIDMDQIMKGEPVEMSEDPIPESSRGRFHMDDASAQDADVTDEEDDIPLAVRVQNRDNSTQVSTEEMHDNMVQMMSGLSDTMRLYGMEPDQMVPMLHFYLGSVHQQQSETFEY